MTDVSDRNFGYLIAYLIPGFVVVAASAPYSPVVRAWFGVPAANAPTIGGFLYATLAAVAAGLLVSALRWLVIDTIHHHTGVEPADLDFTTFGAKHNAFVALAENHYRYAQHYGNLLVVLLISAPTTRTLSNALPVDPPISTVIFLSVLVLLFLASRDALNKYYRRTERMLSST